MNYILGRGLAGKSLDKQLSVNVIYKGITSANDSSSNEKQLFEQAATVTGTLGGGGVEFLLGKSGVSGVTRQLISSILSGFLEMKIENMPNGGKENKEGNK